MVKTRNTPNFAILTHFARIWVQIWMCSSTLPSCFCNSSLKTAMYCNYPNLKHMFNFHRFWIDWYQKVQLCPIGLKYCKLANNWFYWFTGPFTSFSLFSGSWETWTIDLSFTCLKLSERNFQAMRQKHQKMWKIQFNPLLFVTFDASLFQIKSWTNGKYP